MITLHNTAKRALFACIVISAGSFGCQQSLEEDVQTRSQKLVSSCTPSDEYTTCYQVDALRAKTWQETVANNEADGVWRTVVSGESTHYDYRVTIDVEALNGGVIPSDRPKPGTLRHGG